MLGSYFYYILSYINHVYFYKEQINMTNKKTLSKKAAVKLNFQTLFWLFFFGSIIGFVFEGFWQILKKGNWENHSASILGPFCIIYGIAAMILYAISKPLENKNIFLLFFVFAILGSALEFFASLFQELVFGSVSWNYKKQFLNIVGRISLKMTVIWGLLGVAFIKIFYPMFTLLFSKMQSTVWTFTCIILTVFMVVNLLLTSIAVLRWGERIKDNSPASNSVEEFFDEHYDNDRMTYIFTNMKFKESTKS